MTDQERAEQIADNYTLNVIVFNSLVADILSALTLARSEGREEGMKEKGVLTRRDTLCRSDGQPAAADNGR